MTLIHLLRIYLGPPTCWSYCYAEDAETNKPERLPYPQKMLMAKALSSQEAAHALWPLLWWRWSLPAGGAGTVSWGDGIQGRRMCHGEAAETGGRRNTHRPKSQGPWDWSIINQEWESRAMTLKWEMELDQQGSVHLWHRIWTLPRNIFKEFVVLWTYNLSPFLYKKYE